MKKLFLDIICISANNIRFLFVFLFFSQQIFAQDPQFTQFFNTPVYINPALTGTTEQWRANLLHRSQ